MLTHTNCDRAKIHSSRASGLIRLLSLSEVLSSVHFRIRPLGARLVGQIFPCQEASGLQFLIVGDQCA